MTQFILHAQKLYEALKILSAGFVSSVGFGLNEVIKDFVTTSLPPIAFAAPFIADVFSGLIACVMSSLVLMMFDRHKQNIILQKNQSEHSQLCLQLASVKAASAALSSDKNLLLIERTKRAAFESMQSMVTSDSNTSSRFDSVRVQMNGIIQDASDTKERVNSAEERISIIERRNVRLFNTLAYKISIGIIAIASLAISILSILGIL